jgi:hypothetical protein
MIMIRQISQSSEGQNVHGSRSYEAYGIRFVLLVFTV